MNHMRQSWKQEPLVGKLQFGCILFVVLFELLFLSPLGQQFETTWKIADRYLMVPCLAFLLLTFLRGLNQAGKTALVMGVLLLGWITVVQLLRNANAVNPLASGGIICGGVLALPMAYGTRDEKKQWGLYILSGLILLEALRLCVHGAALRYGFLPEALSRNVRWMNGRLAQMFHPNNCATLLMVGIGICLALCFRTRKLWLRVLLLGFAVIQFLVQSITNGRTCILFTGLMVGGILFCAIRKTNWKRALPASLVAVAVMAALFFGSMKLFELHLASMDQQIASSQEEEPGEIGKYAAQNEKRYSAGNHFTLNNRTIIWDAVLKGVADQPQILLYGTDSVYDIVMEWGQYKAEHTHNSFLEALCLLGLPGLLFALAVTVLLVRSAWRLLWRNEDIWKSCIAIIALALFGCGLMEPFLFVVGSSLHYFCFLFLTMVGYLHQWCVPGTEAEKSKAL